MIGALDCIEVIGGEKNVDAVRLVDDALDQGRRAVDGHEERTRERNETEDDTDWTHTVMQKKEEPPSHKAATTKRSVFDDVDE